MRNILSLLKVAILALITMSSTQAMAQKTVTYTFKGRAKGYLLPARPIDLVASGSVPAGVSVSKIDGISYVEVDTGKVNNVAMDGFLGSALLTEYVVNPQTEGRIYFDGFRYELAGIKWSRCSEIAILTSNGTTTAKNYSNTTIGSFQFNTKGDGTYSTGGELFYHTRDFIPNYDYAANKPKGLGMLEVKCTSKQAQHGIAIKDFRISYYEPVITIYKQGANESPVTKLDPGQNDDIRATITDHRGAFTDAEIKFYSSNPDAAIINETTGEITTNSDPNYAGSTIITAKIVYGGAVVSKATYRLTVGSVERQWSFCNIFNQYRTDDNNSFTGTCTKSSTQFTGLRSNNVTPLETLVDDKCFYVYDSDFPADGKSMMIELRKKTQTERPSLGVAKIKYHISVPAYTSVSVANSARTDATPNSTTGLFGGEKNADCRLDIVHIGQANEWPFSNGADAKYQDAAHNYWEEASNLNGNYKFYLSGNTASTNSVYGKNGSTVNSLDGTGNLSGTYKYDQSDKASSKEYDDYFAISVGHLQHSLGNGTNFKLDCKVDINSPATYTYYAYVTFNGNGATYGSMTQQNISTAADVNVKALALNKGDALKGNEFVRTKATGASADYVFAGWVTAENLADKVYTGLTGDEAGKNGTLKPGQSVDYTDQQVFCPYNSDLECGVGPKELYAVWNKIPDPDDLTDPDVDYLVYAVFANGGTFAGSKDHLEGVFVTGQAVNVTGFPATRTGGYTLNGYYDAPEGGTMLFNASGAIQNNATTQEYYFTPDGKWKATGDVYMYAQWTKPASQVKRTITFDPNGGTISGTSKVVTVGESDNNNVNDLEPAQAGYKFAGWYTAGGDMAYNANGESVVLESMSKDPETGANVASFIPVNEHFFDKNYKFVGDAAPFNDNFTVYAHWVPVDVTITFSEGGQSTTNDAKYQIGSNTPVGMDAPNYELTEYDFVKVNRTLKTNAWNTVCFPCDIYKDQVSALFSEVKQFNSFEIQDDGTVGLLFKDVNVMAAGVPYFVKMKEGIAKGSGTSATDEAYVSSEITDNKLTQITLENVQVNKTPGKITVTKGETEVIMHGSYTTKYHIGKGAGYDSDYDYYYLQNDKFYLCEGEYLINGVNKTVHGNNQGFRVYFAVKGASMAPARFFVMLDEFDGWTDIDSIDMDEPTDGSVYDLSGRRLSSKPTRGLYIVNGKKYIAK